MKKIRLLIVGVILLVISFLWGCPQEPTAPVFLSVAITQPQGQITCIQTTRDVPEPCSFEVAGTSTRVVSEPDVGIYVLLEPTRPSAGGLFIQLPPATVQSNGDWSATATLDDELIQVRNGATLNIQAVIAERAGGIENQVNPVPNLADIPGILVQSDPVSITIVVPTPTPVPTRRGR